MQEQVASWKPTSRKDMWAWQDIPWIQVSGPVSHPALTKFVQQLHWHSDCSPRPSTC